MSELWNFAKNVAQAEGRRQDWVYIVDLFKSSGGTDMMMEIYGERGRFEVLGETTNGNVLIGDKQGTVSVIQKSEMKSFRKKFHKIEVDANNIVRKSLHVEGKTEEVLLYINAVR